MKRDDCVFLTFLQKTFKKAAATRDSLFHCRRFPPVSFFQIGKNFYKVWLIPVCSHFRTVFLQVPSGRYTETFISKGSSG